MAKKNDTLKSDARKARRERRNRRHEVADIIVTSHLLAKKLKPAQLKKLLDEFAALSTRQPCAACGTPVPKRDDPAQNLCEKCSQDDSEGR
jgi:hypothetical protein